MTTPAAGVVVVFGSANVDLTVRTRRAPGPGETVTGTTFTESGGGKGANQAVAAARAGARTRFVGCVGDDAFGARLAANLTAAGIDVSGVAVAPATPTGIALIVLDDSHDNRIVVVPGANAALGAAGAEDGRLAAALDGAAVLLLQLEIPIDGTIAAARLGRQRGAVVVVDPAPAPAGGLPAELLALASILTPNEHEAEQLVGFALDTDDAVASAAASLRAQGAQTVIITLGERGAHWAGPEGRGWRRPPPVDAIDTVGAGDAFNGALAAALAEGHPLDTAIAWALAAGALAVTRPGAQDAMPERRRAGGAPMTPSTRTWRGSTRATAPA